MDKVRCVKITRAAFAALDEKDGNAIYFVSESGDFSPESLDTRGEVYLGDKLVGHPNTQPDWGQTDPTADDYVKNKPTVECHASGDVLVHAFPSALHTRLQGVRNVASTTTLNTGKAADNNDLELDLRFTCVTKPTYQYNTILGAMSGSYERFYLGIGTWTSNYNIRLGVRSANGSIDSGIPLVAGHTYSVQAKMHEGIATMHVDDETSGRSFSGSTEYTVDIATRVYIYMLYRSYNGGTILNGVLEYHRAVMRLGGVTRFDYIPAQRLSDSTVGFYDTVSGELVTATAGEFVAGAVTENINDIIVTVDIPPVDGELTFDSDRPVAASALWSNFVAGRWRDHETKDALTGFGLRTGYIATDTLKWTVNSNQYFVYVPLSAVAMVRLKAGTSDGRFAFLTRMDTVTANAQPSYVSGTSLNKVTAGATVDAIVPSDAKYLYVALGSVSGSAYQRMPASLKLTGDYPPENHPLTIGGIAYDGSAPVTLQLPDDSSLVHKTGEETITGGKTFTGVVVVQTPSASGHAVNKAYIDDIVGDIETLLAAI